MNAIEPAWPLRAGERAPAFRLPDQCGHMVMLSALLAKGAAVLRFCHHDDPCARIRELDTLVAVHVGIEQRGATLAVISAQPFHPCPWDKAPAAYAFPLLTDWCAEVARSYGLTSGNRGAPATYVVDQECVVALAFVDLEGRSRMEPDQIVMALECLGKRERESRKRNGPGGPRPVGISHIPLRAF